MNILEETPNGPVAFIGLSAAPYGFTSPFGHDDFALLLWVFDRHVAADEQVSLSRAFVEAGCRFAVCAGHECSSWDDSVDYAYLETDPNFDPPKDRFVMTSWHDGEGVQEVAFFFAHGVSFRGFTCQRRIALCIGGSPEDWQRVQQSVMAYIADEQV